MKLPFFRPREDRKQETNSLRDLALSVSAASLGLSPSEKLPRVWGIVMEEALPLVGYSIVSFGDGSTSIYFMPKGGVIGAGDHDSVRRISETWLALAQDLCEAIPFGSPAAKPKPGDVRLTLRTFDGDRSEVFRGSDLRNSGHRLFRFYACGQMVMAEIRKVSP